MRPKILLVDDREKNLVALAALLQDHDAELLEARSGDEALELLLEHEVALALVDVQMPKMDGFALAELMRGAERTRRIPIIFITAGLRDQTRVFKGYESGAVDFMFKPLDGRVLGSKVEVFLMLDRQKRELALRVAELESALAARTRADESLRGAMARLEEMDRRKNEFLAVLSHELRNPLAPIMNSLHILGHASPDGPQSHRARAVISRQATQLSRLVDDLLEVTRVARNKVVLQWEHLDLNDLVRRAVEDQRSLFDSKDVRLQQALAASPIRVRGDPARLSQVIGNLLQNAAKFTGGGGMTQVTTELDESGNRAVIRVRDSGVGMMPETLARLFTPFMQADATLERSKGGLGLGLALVKGLVALHGGDVAANSDGIGKGAEFVISLPLVAAVPVEYAIGASSRAVSSPRRVLIIEDNIDAAQTLREVLELAQHEVEVAYSGPEGIAKARRCAPEVVLCDIGLPGIDGFEVARTFRADEKLRSAFLVALSGYALPEDIERAHAAGFDRHLAKPPRLEQLEELLGKLAP